MEGGDADAANDADDAATDARVRSKELEDDGSSDAGDGEIVDEAIQDAADSGTSMRSGCGAEITADASGSPQQAEAESNATVQPRDRQRLGAAQDLVEFGGPVLGEVLPDIIGEATGSQADESMGEPVQPAANLLTD